MYKALSILLLFSISIGAQAQTTYQLDKSESSLVIQGTSSVHDWESNVEDFSISMTTTEGETFTIESLSFEAVTKSIKSGKRIMDRKTHGALNEGDYPVITFQMSDMNELTADSVTITGIVALAGQEREVTMTAGYTRNGNDLIINGSQPLVMSDFGIDPPTAMMGTLKTGDEVTLKFNLHLTK
jgi:polyisoprenoid-binding protein YceI